MPGLKVGMMALLSSITLDGVDHSIPGNGGADCINVSSLNSCGGVDYFFVEIFCLTITILFKLVFSWLIDQINTKRKEKLYKNNIIAARKGYDAIISDVLTTKIVFVLLVFLEL